jgi:hypothetical protein
MSIFDEMERDAVAFQKAPTAEESQTLTQMGLELVEIDRRLEKYAEVAKALMERKLQLQMKDMVSAMEAVNQDVIGLGDQNCDLVLSDYFKAGLPNPDTAKDDEERARMAVLRQQGIDFLTLDAPDILSTTVVVTMPKGSLEKAKELVAYITSEQGGGVEAGRVEIAEGVHWGTLTSYVKEQVRDRKRSDLPLEALGATVGRIVKIVKRKAKK